MACHHLDLLFCPVSVALGQGIQDQPDRAAIARAGHASIKRLETESASWTTTTTIPGGIKFVVNVIASPHMKRSVLSVEVGSRHEELARITQKEGVWYVVQGGKAGRYRPFEAPLDVPTAYVYLTRSDPLFVTETHPARFGTFEGIKDGIATYRTPLPEPLRKQLENTIAGFERFNQQISGRVLDPETAKSMLKAKALLASGISTGIE